MRGKGGHNDPSSRAVLVCP